MSKQIKSHVAILMANLIYGVNYVVAKGVMPDYIKPLGLVFYRVLGASILFWIFSLFLPKERVAKKDLLYIAVCAIFGVVGNQMLFLAGLNYTSPIDASIMMTVNPILVLVIASILIKEKITNRKIVGIVVGAAGAIWLILNKGEIDFSAKHFMGNIMIFLNALSYALYLVMIKPIMMKYKPVTVMKWVFVFGLIMVIPIAGNQAMQVDWWQIPTSIYLSIGYVIIFSTFVAYLCNIYALRNVKPTTVSIYIYSQPVIATVVAMILGQSDLTIIKILAAVLVFIGVYLVSIPRKKFSLKESFLFRKLIS